MFETFVGEKRMKKEGGICGTRGKRGQRRNQRDCGVYEVQEDTQLAAPKSSGNWFWAMNVLQQVSPSLRSISYKGSLVAALSSFSTWSQFCTLLKANYLLSKCSLSQVFIVWLTLSSLDRISKCLFKKFNIHGIPLLTTWSWPHLMNLVIKRKPILLTIL